MVGLGVRVWREAYSKMGEVGGKAKEGRRAKMREEGGRAGWEKRGKIGPFHLDRFLLHMIDTMCL